MNAYLIESTLILFFLLGVYKLLLEGEKVYQFNRFFLIGAILFGLTAPLISVDLNIFNSMPRVEYESMMPLSLESESPSPQTDQIKNETDIEIATSDDTEKNMGPALSDVNTESLISPANIIIVVYLLGLGFMGFRFTLSLQTLLSSLSHYEARVYKGKELFLTGQSIAPFTFFSWIFISKKDFEAGEISESILQHELTHAQQLHTLDVLFVEVLKVVFWFNPVFYFYKRAIQLNHEFIADEKVISTSKDVAGYQKLILKMVNRSSGLSLSSSFNYPSTKKRFNMMIKEFSPIRSYSKKMLLLPIILATTLMFCTTQESEYPQKVTGNNDKLYSNVDLYIDPDRADELGIEKRGTGIMFDETGNPFTGTQQVRHVSNDSLYSETVYMDGVLKSNTVYNEDGTLMGKYEFDYIGEKFLTTKRFNKDGLLIEEWISPTADDTLGSIKQWHSNGQLKFEMTFKENLIYHGLMTRYNENGDVIKQEKYENGELVEKVK